MNVSALHTLTEDLAGFLSEVTESDLRRTVPGSAGDMGDLYVRLIDQTLSAIEAMARRRPAQRADRPTRSSLGTVVDNYGGCGLESRYRQAARLMENAFSTATDVNRPRHVEGLQDTVDIATSMRHRSPTR